MHKFLLLVFLLLAISCSPKQNPNEVWVYTSLYKDTIADIKPLLKREFPDIDVKFYQAGSEEVAAKVNAEILAGGTKADLLITSDRFWYEELAQSNNLHPLSAKRINQVPASLKHPNLLYSTLSIPVMVLAYNADVLKANEVPKTFKELVEEKWKGRISTGSPLASGTNFTTVAFLSKTYGWDFFKNLQNNNTISEGGNSAVLRRIQNKERPLGWVLLENVLRLTNRQKQLRPIFPEDGVIFHNNVLAITKKEGDRKNVEKVSAWLFSEAGQRAMVRSYMYSPFKDFEAPKGAPPFNTLAQKNFVWSREFIDYVVKNRNSIKEKFSEIMFN